MNAAGRKLLDNILADLQPLFDLDVESAMERLAEVRGEEEEKFENMSEGLQEGATGQKIQAAINALEELDEKLGELHDMKDDIRDLFETAKNPDA